MNTKRFTMTLQDILQIRPIYQRMEDVTAITLFGFYDDDDDDDHNNNLRKAGIIIVF